MKSKTPVAILGTVLFLSCSTYSAESPEPETGDTQSVAENDTEKPVEQLTRAQWTAKEANDWYAQRGPLIGFNYVPRTAVNQLEMWQTETWDPKTIEEELSWAAEIGLNTARVFLHDLLWNDDKVVFLERIDTFLDIADTHGIGVMLVFFDGVWNPYPKAGTQPEPTPGVHNSQWVQSPGAEILNEPERYEELAPYVKGVISAFRDDPRVVVWDLFNEPNNPNVLAYPDVELEPELKAQRALQLLTLTKEWALSVNPVQPLTAGVWDGEWSDASALTALNAFMLQELDVVSFHSYADKDVVTEQIAALKAFGRPILCTEYMARPLQSTFEDILPLFATENIGAYQWGFVNGRSQTIYPWWSWLTPSEMEPDPWFHDLLHGDGTPYDPSEIEIIRKVLSSIEVAPNN